MTVYITVSETKFGEKNILGAFSDMDTARRKLGEYRLDNPEEEGWGENFDTDCWQYETSADIRIVHRTRVHKDGGMKSHVIVFTKEVAPLVEETGDWYVICNVFDSFDREEGLRKNLQVLEEFLAEEETEN